MSSVWKEGQERTAERRMSLPQGHARFCTATFLPSAISLSVTPFVAMPSRQTSRSNASDVYQKNNLKWQNDHGDKRGVYE